MNDAAFHTSSAASGHEKGSLVASCQNNAKIRYQRHPKTISVAMAQNCQAFSVGSPKSQADQVHGYSQNTLSPRQQKTELSCILSEHELVDGFSMFMPISSHSPPVIKHGLLENVPLKSVY